MPDIATTASNSSAPAQGGAALPLEARFAQIKAALQKECGDTAFRSWIAPTAAVSLQAGVLDVAAPTRFVRDWVKTRYADRMCALWRQHFGQTVHLTFSVRAPAPAAQADEEQTADALVPVANQNAQDAQTDISSPLDARFTFENYVTGKSNALAYAAARKVADDDTVAFNPLFLQGGVGLGKTHLMHAIAHAVRARNPARKVVYMSAEKFMYQFVRALRFKDTMAFKEQFRTVDVLMIDDIQFICGKESTQEEFFHTFNALIDQGKHIVVSADKSPSDLDGLEERLRSRLGMGLVADIHPTSYELRLSILQSKCAQMNRALPQDVLEFLADKIAANVRELEGALNRLIAHAELVNRAVTLESAQELLQDLLRANDRRVTVEDIQKKVAAHYNIRVADMHSPRRARAVARPRQVAMYLCKTLTQHSLPEIGRKFGGRDHTTIIHGVRKIEELMTSDRALQDDVQLLTRTITG